MVEVVINGISTGSISKSLIWTTKKNDLMVDSSTITSTHAPSYKDRQKFEIQILIPCQIFDQRCGWLKCKNENNYERFSDSW